MNEYEQDEQDFGASGALWDAGEGVCCAAFQLGACAHTEAQSFEDELTVFDLSKPYGKPYSCGHLPEGICDGCLEARITPADAIAFFLANYHTGEIIEIRKDCPQEWIDELVAIGGYVRFDTLEGASDWMHENMQREEEFAGPDALSAFVIDCANDCVEGR